MLGNNYGIDNTVNLVKFGCDIGVAVKKSLQDDGKITWTDSYNFLRVIPSGFCAIGSFGKAIPEMKDEITPEERSKIVQEIKNSELIPLNDEGKIQEWVDCMVELKRLMLRDIIKT